jgi:flagellar hook-length control protein FliK
MMGAASLPQPQGSTPAGFAAFLSTIGQTPTGSGEDGGFEQLLAAIPAVDAAAPKAAAVMPNAVVTPVAAAVAAPAVPVAAHVAAGDVIIAAPVAGTKDGTPQTDPDTVAASTAKLLIEWNGSAATPETKSLKAIETEAKSNGTSDDAAATVAAPETPAPATTPAPAAALPIAAAPVTAAVIAAVVGKPMQASDRAAPPTGEAAPTAEGVAPAPTAAKTRSTEAKPAAAEIETMIAAPAPAKPRAAPLPGPAFTGSEAVAPRSADAAPAMTIQFAQPMTASAATLANTAAPVTVAERVLDLAGDGAWIDQLAHDIAATRSDSGDISFRLMPRHLGRLDVAMLVGDEGVSLKLDTQHEATATIVTAAQGRLVEDLRQQGVRVTGSEVTCTPGDSNRQMQGQSQGQGRAAAQDVSHLIETVTERAKARDPEEAADRRGRFA